MRILQVAGPSRSGKTTRATKLVGHFVARGLRVGAIKHTHHPLNEDAKGDTALFVEAGADPVVLAAESEGVIFRAGTPSRIAFESVESLIHTFHCDILIIEGFKNRQLGERIEDGEEVFDNSSR